MRDGIYDYELLKMLEQKNPEKARELANSVIINFNEYDSDIRYFRKIRKQLLETLAESN